MSLKSGSVNLKCKRWLLIENRRFKVRVISLNNKKTPNPTKRLNLEFCLWATKKIFSALLRMNSNSRKTMHRLRRYDVFRFAQNDVARFTRNDAMFAQCAVRHTSFVQRTSLGEAVIICRRQTSFKKRTFVSRQKCVFCWCG